MQNGQRITNCRLRITSYKSSLPDNHPRPSYNPLMRWPLRILPAVALALLATAFSPAQNTDRAGEVRLAQAPAEIVRSLAPPFPAVRSEPVDWQDLLRTGRAGRIRVGLLDGSLLNVGADSELRVLRHDPATSQTDLELLYGRLRANIVRRVQPGAQTRVRTRTATVGVVGTRFWIAALAAYTEVICLYAELLVRNVDNSIAGEVRLRSGQFTRVALGQPPAPARNASDEQLREAEDSDLFADPALSLSRVELSWPPPACTDSVTINVRAWQKSLDQGREVESQVDAEWLVGRLQLGDQSFPIEAGQLSLAPAPARPPAAGNFVPWGKTQSVPVKVWPPLDYASGDAWRAPRAVVAGNAFYVLGPAAGPPSVSVADQLAEPLWWGHCGAAVMAPMLSPQPQAAVPLVVRQFGRPVATGQLNTPRIVTQAPQPPVAVRGQTINFSVSVPGLGGLNSPSGPRAPVASLTVTNQTPQILGNLRCTAPGAQNTGQTSNIPINPSKVPPTGAVQVQCSARGLQVGAFLLNVQLTFAAPPQNLSAPPQNITAPVPSPPRP